MNIPTQSTVPTAGKAMATDFHKGVSAFSGFARNVASTAKMMSGIPKAFVRNVTGGDINQMLKK